MKAVVYRAFGGTEVLEVAERPVPEPGPGEVRIAVEAAAVNPIDLGSRSGFTVQAGIAPAPGSSFERGLGWDVAGRISAGEGFAAGTAVVGLLPAFAVATGTQASFVVVPADSVAPAPSGIEPARAATLPLNSLTADAALRELDLPTGAHLMVLGGAGGVGAFAVQLAVRAGLRVTATASSRDARTVESFGATVVARDALPSGVDGVLDTVGLGAAALAPVRDGGVLVTVAGPVEGERGIRSVQALVRPDGARLAELATLASTGALALPSVTTYPLDEVAAAQDRLAAGGVGGRLVLVP
ncbi:NADP-dependent oxidoreductase [Pseudonocardia ailaonensis]|uniref:NADP-dependent oxidoreductase n=1 Tax=Pseudonocardia ailaonensis TaxID=367279 RepID=A0ABN2MYL9_9PSEU